jgi:molybdopterin molybdotransferase
LTHPSGKGSQLFASEYEINFVSVQACAGKSSGISRRSDQACPNRQTKKRNAVMPSFEEARKLILERVSRMGTEKVFLLDAGGRVLAEDMTAPWDMPRYSNSAMDGYAVRADDCKPGTTLKVIDFVPAGGIASVEVTAGTAVKIMTGAPLPPGADAIVPVEDADDADRGVQIRQAVERGAHIRLKSEDVKAGECIIPAGTILRPAEIGMLASYGKVMVTVFRRVRVALLSTGDELAELGEMLTEEKIINSNTLALAAALRETGAEPIILGIARDNRESHMEKMLEGLQADVLITSAGVSTGDRDFVRAVLEEMGAVFIFNRVDIKPGRPTTFGLMGAKPLFCLPGNPVSSMITYEELVRPALLKMMGHERIIKPLIEATLLSDLTKKRLGVLNFQRVSIEVRDGKYFASSSGDQNTGILKTLVRADALALLPEDRDHFEAGDVVPIHLLGSHVDMLQG